MMDVSEPGRGMAAEESQDSALQWGALTESILSTPSHFADMENYEGTFEYLRDECRVLVIGAGGLGCEILKDLAYSGFRQIDVIDLDTIDISNLNRQFLFQQRHVGQYKADVAAEAINERLGRDYVCVTPHVGKIQSKDPSFYRQFNLIIAGLDNIEARRWINNLVHSLVERDPETGEPDLSTTIPLLDGGTEGLRGQARLIMPTQTSCFECSLDMFPPQVNFPLCTIAETPRLPEHCIEYALVILWDRVFGEKRTTHTVTAASAAPPERQAEQPETGVVPEGTTSDSRQQREAGQEGRGEDEAHRSKVSAEIEALTKEIAALQKKILPGETTSTSAAAVALDKDSPVHMQWLYKQALRRGLQFGIAGVTYQLTMGVVKRIIPAVASTNAIISAALVQEALKVSVYCSGTVLDNYFMYMGHDGLYSHTFRYEKKPDCLVCSDAAIKAQTVLEVPMRKTDTLAELLTRLGEMPQLQLKRPSITTSAGIVFLQNPPSLRREHEYKLHKSLSQLVEFGVFKEKEPLFVTDPQCLPSCNIKIQVVLT
ncbi:unnamed protein product [Amoebophrya sp. A120]|nr:unnamed protein product [Amoebophrya sp. A120]|eukprot:GSA120T00011747001.1